MQEFAQDPPNFVVNTFAILVILTALALYLLPTIIAAFRRHSNFGPIFVVNVVFGWTLIGYVVSLAWSLANRSKENPMVVTQITQPQTPQPMGILQQTPAPLPLPVERPLIDVSQRDPKAGLKIELRELQVLLDDDLITAEEYAERRHLLLSQI